MATKYKITKYKGKTSIKDTKTGKSQEINMEKFMNGGYKDINSYEVGGMQGCPPGQSQNSEGNCVPDAFISPFSMPFQGAEQSSYIGDIQAKRKAKLAGDLGGIESSIDPNTGMAINKKAGLIEERDAVKAIDTSGLRRQGVKSLSDPKKYLEDLNTTQSQGVEDRTKNKGEKPQQNYNFANPYAGVDIPSAANYLGASIKKGDTLGGLTAGLKVATGLGRNIVSGMGQANREDQTMMEALKNLKDQRNPMMYGENGGKLDTFAYGGKKDEELATGEYMRGVDNENTQEYNAEIEKGEYFQTNQGDIAEVVGNKHSQGGEKINMEAEDRVLSDKLTLGASTAKMLASKYDLNVKAKNTYSDVLDKFRKKMKLDKIIDEESEVIKKIAAQEKVGDATTRDFNLQVLAEKKSEIEAEKNPIEELRKGVFDDLYNLQEASKPKEKSKPTNEFEDGGQLYTLAQEYGITIDRAKELVQEFRNGGKMVPEYVGGGTTLKVGDIDPITGKRVTKEFAQSKIKSGEWEDLGEGKYVDRGSENRRSTGISFEDAWNSGKVDKDTYPTFEIFKQEAIKQNQTMKEEDKFFYSMDNSLTPVGYQNMGNIPEIQGIKGRVNGIKGNEKNPNSKTPEISNNYMPTEQEQINGMGMYLFPDQQPLPPSGMMGTIKPEARFDRISPNEVDVNPYLQSIQDREQSQMQNLEGLSPNVRAAVMANLRANTQGQESQIRNQIDTQNLGSQEKAEYANAQIQRQEQLQNNNYRQSFEQRTYQSLANQERDMNDYYNQLQSIGKQRFQDIENLNMINQNNEDMVYIPGRGFVRKQGSSNKNLVDNTSRNKGLIT